MVKPKVLILRTAGTNCDKETQFAFERSKGKTELLHITVLKRKRSLSDYQIICLPGGFSYGDDLGAGKIFSLELKLWLKDSLVSFIQKGGLIIGICNGFQILVKTGILPDCDFQQKVTLTLNDSGRFEDRWTYLKKPETPSGIPFGELRTKLGANRNQKPERDIWLRGLPEIIQLPVAHAEGKFYTDNDTLDRIERGGQIAFQYVDEHGAQAGYPYCPNGSLRNIAGITDTSGRVLGLMPHPERFTFGHHHPLWHIRDSYPWGSDIFNNAVNYFK